jgi:molecular chaperone Hsp33
MSDESIGEPSLNVFEAFGEADDNVVQSFQLDASLLRGRCVRLGSVLDNILAAHDYPKPIAHLVAETVSLALLLSSMLKYEGIFTLQTKGDGPVSMLVADVCSNGDVRGCASYDPERLEHAREQLLALKATEDSQNHLAQYLGKGYIAFTVDQGEAMERYQGIVELNGSSLVDCVQHYFNQSEQIETGIKMSVGQRDGAWRAGGLMVQKMPEEGGHDAEIIASNLDEDDWRRVMVLMDSCTEDEFLDPNLHSNMLLMRLFHDEGVRVFEPLTIQKNCRCTQERVEGVLAMMSDEDVDYMNKSGKILMRCEFCSHEYSFDFDAVKKERAKAGAAASSD